MSQERDVTMMSRHDLCTDAHTCSPSLAFDRFCSMPMGSKISHNEGSDDSRGDRKRGLGCEYATVRTP